MKEDGEHLDILACGARNPGAGQFRLFIQQAKKHFREISIWEVWNPWLGEALERYGFVFAKKTEPDGEKLEGFIWREKTPPG